MGNKRFFDGNDTSPPPREQPTHRNPPTQPTDQARPDETPTCPLSPKHTHPHTTPRFGKRSLTPVRRGTWGGRARAQIFLCIFDEIGTREPISALRRPPFDNSPGQKVATVGGGPVVAFGGGGFPFLEFIERALQAPPFFLPAALASASHWMSCAPSPTRGTRHRQMQLTV